METTNELLDQIKARYDLHSDYALAAKLGMTRSLVSAYRNNKRMLGDDAGMRVAELLDLDPAYVFASMEAQRTQNEAARAVWERLADFVKHHGAAAALLLLVAVPSLTPTPANAAPASVSGGLYIMLNNKARVVVSTWPDPRCWVSRTDLLLQQQINTARSSHDRKLHFEPNLSSLKLALCKRSSRSMHPPGL